jgi:cell division protein FtsW
MNKRFMIWENPRDAILSIVFLLMALGCINVFSASFVRADAMFHDSYYFLKRYVIWGSVGLVLMWLIGFKWNYKYFLSSRFVSFIYWVTFGLLLAVDVIGVTVNGSRRWLYVLGISLQPSEVAKVVEVMLAASFLGKRMMENKPIRLDKYVSAKAFLFVLLYGALIFKQPDMGTMGIVVALMLVMYIIAGIPVSQIVKVVGAGVSLLIALALVAPYRLQRFLTWLDPWKDAQGSGYQLAQSLLAIGSGGLVGVPWGQGSSKFFYLPEAHTDFAFAIFCQEWGFIGALLLIALFVIFARALIKVASHTKDKRGFLLVSGVACLLVGQSAANMAMVCGIIPVIGVPLMFISYGGTSMVINMICIGLVLSVYRDECKRELMEARVAQGLPPIEHDKMRIVTSHGIRRGE